MLSAYKDNAAVMEGSEVGRFFADREAGAMTSTVSLRIS